MNSAAQKMLSNSPNLDELFPKHDSELVKTIKEISNTDSLKACTAIKKLCEIIELPKKKAILEAYEELFVQNVVAQLKNLEKVPITNSLVVYQPLFTMLYAFVGFNSLGKALSVGCVKNLMNALLTLMADQKLHNSDDKKMVNDICLKLLEKVNLTYINCALIHLLRETCAADNLTKLTDLLIKCIWRIAKVLEERSNELNYDIVIMEVHNFMLSLPSSFWRTRPTDTPMRAVKMIIYNMTKLKGNAILQHLQQIPKDSEFHEYLFKILKHLQRDGSLQDDLSQHSTGNVVPEKCNSNHLKFQAVFEEFVEDRLALKLRSNVE